MKKILFMSILSLISIGVMAQSDDSVSATTGSGQTITEQKTWSASSSNDIQDAINANNILINQQLSSLQAQIDILKKTGGTTTKMYQCPVKTTVANSSGSYGTCKGQVLTSPGTCTYYVSSGRMSVAQTAKCSAI